MDVKAYTPDEVAQIFQISKHTVYELIKRGELQAFKIGNKMRIEHTEIERFKENMKAPAKKQPPEQIITRSKTNAPIRLSGSHDFLVEHFAKQAGQALHMQILPSFIGSLEGLMMLYRGQSDIAAIHLLDPASQEYNLPFIHQLFVYESILVVRLAEREQGLIVTKGNPKSILDFSDLTRKDIQFINRQKGSGTRFLLDSKLSSCGIAPSKINGYGNEEWNHLSAASYISRGIADVTFGIQSAASHLGLDFVPVATEQFDLVFRFTDENKQSLTDLIHYLQSANFKNSLQDLEGYSIQALGKIIYQTTQTEELV
ncbi:helix-turn-helix transcriptional regulator [Neobacillus sp. MM2021_6]|uniref:substrate-binding domain-containing protein n=1 Tax=Bacillaceae TaxID=186817 RepID=UPI00140DCE0C|nr:MULTISPECIES: helix-turn-helix transcriptional regulator [Bacillaceae]MBO0958965.1 helix-turn-helix transcriptional regulator [Neobacillus sp. MM2021_6]NHC17695.1 helix-turn-helix transcriptional regulator [Bacillus sp. MM2020_4]